MFPTPIFLCSIPGSGAGLLARLLAYHPQITAFKKAREGQFLQQVYPTLQPDAGFTISQTSRLNEHSELVTPDNAQLLQSQWAEQFAERKPYFVEYSSGNILRTRFLQALLPHSIFILLTRHPLSFAYRQNGSNVKDRFEHWSLAHHILLKDLERIERAVMLRYEDLVASPNLVLQELTEKLGLVRANVSEVCETSRNARYFQAFEADYDQDPLLLTRLRLMREIPNRFGYILKPPYVAKAELKVVGTV